MQYDFNKPVDRSDNFSAKWNELENIFGRRDLVPLWVADMDLPAAQPIVAAIARRNEQAMYGYTSRPDSYFKAACDWQEQRNGWKIDSSLVTHTLGVVPALATLVREFSNPGDNILFCTPVYSEFYNIVEDWGRVALTCQLKEDAGHYTIDFDLFERCLQKQPAMFILCSPHNPVGRVWTRDELEKIGDLCLKYGVMVASDEIHSDLILWNNKHIPFASVKPEFARNTVTCISAAKTFNLAGLHASITVFPDTERKDKFDKFWKGLAIHRNNCFSLVAVEAAFRHGGEWLDQLLRHIEGNAEYICGYLEKHIPQIRVRLPESTYLLWLDCKGLGLDDKALADFMINRAHLAMNRGITFGTGGEGHMRLNVACPRMTLEKAMQQLSVAVNIMERE